MKEFWILCIFTLTLSLSSCDSGVEIENPPVDRLIYINGKISPQDSSLKITVMRAVGLSEHVFDDSQQAKDAVVIISDRMLEARLEYNSYWKRFEGINIFRDAKAGTRFTITVTTPDGASAVAHSILPPKPKLISFKHTYENRVVKYNLLWDNQEGHRFFQAWSNLKGTTKDGQGNLWPVNYTENLSLEPEVFFWDTQPAGINNLTDSVLIYYNFLQPATLSFTLANMEESTWKYERTFSKYRSWLSNAEESTIVPVFREPVDVYNNIEGGFGIFTSYNCSDSLKVVIKP